MHPGNILVQEKPPTNENGKSEFQLELPYDPFSAFSSLDLGDMVYPNKAETKQTEFRLVILDCGIVTLVRREKLWHAFRETFKAIINGEVSISMLKYQCDGIISVLCAEGREGGRFIPGNIAT